MKLHLILTITTLLSFTPAMAQYKAPKVRPQLSDLAPAPVVQSDWEESSSYKVEGDNSGDRNVASGPEEDKPVKNDRPRGPSSGDKNPAVSTDQENPSVPTNKVDFWKWEKKRHGRDR